MLKQILSNPIKRSLIGYYLLCVVLNVASLLLRKFFAPDFVDLIGLTEYVISFLVILVIFVCFIGGIIHLIWKDDTGGCLTWLVVVGCLIYGPFIALKASSGDHASGFFGILILGLQKVFVSALLSLCFLMLSFFSWVACITIWDSINEREFGDYSTPLLVTIPFTYAMNISIFPGFKEYLIWEFSFPESLAQGLVICAFISIGGALYGLYRLIVPKRMYFAHRTLDKGGH